MLLLVVLLVSLLGAEATLYQDCGSDAEVLEFTLTDCDLPPCIVHRPGSYDVNITFTAAHGATSLDTKINANIGGINYPWPGPDGCPLLLGEQCPLVAGTTYHYHAKMPVHADYPALSVIVTWKLLDEQDRSQFCAVFPITLV